MIESKFACKDGSRFDKFKIILYGKIGSGKSTIAAGFPKPHFIRTEAGLRSIPIENKSEILTNIADIMAYIDDIDKFLIKTPGAIMTLILDNLTQIDDMLMKQVASECPYSTGKNIGFFATHKGFGVPGDMVKARHSMLNSRINSLREKHNLNVIYIGHEGLREQASSLTTENYSISTVEIYSGKKTHAVYTVDADIVARISIPAMEVSRGRDVTVGNTTKRLPGRVSNDDKLLDHRELCCVPMDCHDTKNNIGIQEIFIYQSDENPLLEAIKEQRKREREENNKSKASEESKKEGKTDEQ